MALSKIKTVLDAIANSEEYSDTGKMGEQFIYRVLKGNFFSKQILRNVYIKKENGKSTEIDILVVTSRGIYVIESKNLSGIIYGNGKDAKWTQFLNQNTKYPFYNPIRQNETHINALKAYLKDYPDLAYFNIVIFSDRCQLKIKETDNAFVINRGNLDNTIKKIVDTNTKSLSEKQKKEIIKLLSSLSRPDDGTKEQHIEQVKEDLSMCPFCKEKLVERHNRNTGEPFFGCPNYPKCRYSRKKTN